MAQKLVQKRIHAANRTQTVVRQVRKRAIQRQKVLLREQSSWLLRMMLRMLYCNVHEAIVREAHAKIAPNQF
jgi:hypothetical protein